MKLVHLFTRIMLLFVSMGLYHCERASISATSTGSPIASSAAGASASVAPTPSGSATAISSATSPSAASSPVQPPGNECKALTEQPADTPAWKDLLDKCTNEAKRVYEDGEEFRKKGKIEDAVKAWNMAYARTLSKMPPARLSRMRLGEVSLANGVDQAAICHFTAALSEPVWCHPDISKPLSDLAEEAGCKTKVVCQTTTPPGKLRADAADKASLGYLGTLLCRSTLKSRTKFLDVVRPHVGLPACPAAKP